MSIRALVTVGLASAFASLALACSAPPSEPTPAVLSVDKNVEKNVDKNIENNVEKDVMQHAATTPAGPLAQKKFGAAITETTSTPLDGILREPAKYRTKTVRTEGVVTAVCKAMGCWMEIGQPGGQAHVRMAGHSFFVPKDASGHHAVVQGKVLPTSDDECAEEAKAQTGAVGKIELEATGVEFVD